MWPTGLISRGVWLRGLIPLRDVGHWRGEGLRQGADWPTPDPVPSVLVTSFLRQLDGYTGNLAEASGHASTLIDIHDHADLCCCLLR